MFSLFIYWIDLFIQLFFAVVRLSAWISQMAEIAENSRLNITPQAKIILP
jgi:hypothetical protein